MSSTGVQNKKGKEDKEGRGIFWLQIRQKEDVKTGGREEKERRRREHGMKSCINKHLPFHNLFYFQVD